MENPNRFRIDNTKDKIIKMSLFILINAILIRYFSNIDLAEKQQIIILMIILVSYVIIETYYPSITIYTNPN